MSRSWVFAWLGLLCAGSPAQGADHTLPVRTVDRWTPVSQVVGSPEVSPRDSLLFLGLLPPAVFGLAAFGDTDQDGADEIILNVNDPMIGFTARVLEYQTDNVYQETLRWQSFFYPYEICDLDRDGKREVFGQQDGNRLYVYESPTSSSHPTSIAWVSPPLSNVIGYATSGDTDRDGKLEIIHSINTLGTSRIVIYENKGDNEFGQVFFDIVSPQDNGRKVIADFDGDGLVEIAFSGTYGYLHIYESPSDDAWQQVFVDSTGLDNAYGIAGGQDTDGNGRPELFVAGNLWDEKTQTLPRKIYVYEAPCPNTYVRVATLTYLDNHTGGLESGVLVTNIDNVGLPELVILFSDQIDIYRSPAPGQWDMTVAATPPASACCLRAIYAFDANNNQLPEVFWLSGANSFTTSIILEHPGVPLTDNQVLQQPVTERLIMTPTPAGGHATILLGPRAATASRLSVFDASGRLVGRYPLRPNSGNELSWSTVPFRPGIYFVRAETSRGGSLASGRAVIVR